MTALTYAKEARSFDTGVPDMTYQLKDQDITPPPPDPADQRSAASDGLAALAMVIGALGLIALIVSQVVR